MEGGGPNWLGLLKWSLSHSDGTSPSTVHPMSNEDKQWLEKVMKEIVKDEGQRLCEILKEFREIIDNGIKTEDEVKITELLEETQTMIDQIDMANVFVKFGGIKVLKLILSSNLLTEQLKCLACIVLGELAQNNPIVQDQMFQNGVIDDLCLICMTCTSSKLCLKAIYGLSCLIRGHRHSEMRFFHELNGPTFLHHLLQRNDTSCTIKVLFFLSALLSSDFINLEMLTTYCDTLFELYCYPYLRYKTTDLECDSTLQLFSSMSQSSNGRRYLHQNQSRILTLLEEKYQMIQEEKKNSNEDDYQTALDLITLITDSIKRGIQDLPPPPPTAASHSEANGGGGAGGGASSGEQQQLRICG